MQRRRVLKSKSITHHNSEWSGKKRKKQEGRKDRAPFSVWSSQWGQVCVCGWGRTEPGHPSNWATRRGVKSGRNAREEGGKSHQTKEGEEGKRGHKGRSRNGEEGCKGRERMMSNGNTKIWKREEHGKTLNVRKRWLQFPVNATVWRRTPTWCGSSARWRSCRGQSSSGTTAADPP